jgi:hypothetical protein
LVVPRSMPTALAIVAPSSFAGRSSFVLSPRAPDALGKGRLRPRSRGTGNDV